MRDRERSYTSIAAVSALSGCDRCREKKRKGAAAAARALDTITRRQRTIHYTPACCAALELTS